jgi:hypothetical protein
MNAVILPWHPAHTTGETRLRALLNGFAKTKASQYLPEQRRN